MTMTPEQQKIVDDLVKRIQSESAADVPGMDIHVSSPKPVTVTEVKNLIAANPDHPNAKIFANAIRGMPDSFQVMIDKVDLLSLAQNKVVEVEKVVVETAEGKNTELRKKVGGDFKKDDTASVSPPNANPPEPTEERTQEVRAEAHPFNVPGRRRQ